MVNDTFFRQLADQSVTMQCIVKRDGTFVYANPAWTRVLGWDVDELIGTNMAEKIHPDDLEETLAEADEVWETRNCATGLQNRYRTKDGLYRTLEWYSSPDDSGVAFAYCYDVTEAYRSNSRAAEIEEVSGVCGWEVDLETQTVFWSPGTRRLIGWVEERNPTVEEALSFYPQESLDVLMPLYERLLNTGKSFVFEMPHKRATGGTFLARGTGAAEMRGGKVLRVYGTFEDITERRNAEQAALQRERELRREAEAAYAAERKALENQAWLARHDTLTGLGNRQLLDDTLGAQDGDISTVVVVDLDLFKHVNDSFGHDAGDHVLKQTAERLLAGAGGRKDSVFRIGGDEFVMVLRANDMTIPAHDFCNWMVDQLSESTVYEGVNLRVGASLGFSEIDKGACPKKALRQADIALYEAKSQGRKRSLGYTDSIGAAHVRKRELANDLKAAVENGDISIALQPQVNAATRELSGVEVLARWSHPERGAIPPMTFIPLAEEINLLASLDKIVLDLALDARRELADKGFELPKMSVNVSAKRLTSSDLLDEISRRDDIPGSGLAFEVLETAFLDSIEGDVRKQIDGLRAHGIQIEVDDFGTGHASFASVFALKPDVLKLDRMFVPGVDTDPAKRETVDALVKIARNVGARTLIEGVETDAEEDALVRLGVDFLQGFGIGRPMRSDEFLNWVNQGRLSLSA